MSCVFSYMNVNNKWRMIIKMAGYTSQIKQVEMLDARDILTPFS